MFITIAGLTTKVVVGAAAVALTGAGAVATMAATAPASASGSSPSQSSASSTPEATLDASPEATNEPGDDNGVDPTSSPTPSQDDVAVTRAQAIAIAQARFPQGSLHEVELESEDGVVVWKVDLRAADGSRAKIWVDASSGTIVRERFKDAKKSGPRPSASPRDDRADDRSGSGREDRNEDSRSGREDDRRGGDDNPSSDDLSGADDRGSNSGRDGSED